MPLVLYRGPFLSYIFTSKPCFRPYAPDHFQVAKIFSWFLLTGLKISLHSHHDNNTFLGSSYFSIFFDKGWMPMLWTIKEISTAANDKDMIRPVLSASFAWRLKIRNTDMDPLRPDQLKRMDSFQPNFFLHGRKSWVEPVIMNSLTMSEARKISMASPQ